MLMKTKREAIKVPQLQVLEKTVCYPRTLVNINFQVINNIDETHLAM